ncbi:iron permease [Rhodocollybia butyracea]|uniref:Iron permease n=1 Tax=Rhodocollybia butyracea TaxID=206335 RepID=A0A9P5Q0U7_9AGAR|nr:iron permease [Rhodocollybia butyracea]
MVSVTSKSLVPTTQTKARKGPAFWLSFLALSVSVFLSALDLSAVATALPTIIADLKGGDDFSWVGSAYALSSTSFLPLSGRAADIFGRKPVMLLSVLLFATGSAISGAAQNMSMLIAARTIQGAGGGGILSMTSIITSDLVPLAERGLYQGIIGATWAVAAAIGPPLGGVIAQSDWRWLFYLNLPLAGISFGLVSFFLQVRHPPGSFREKITRIDALGNLIIIGGTTLAVIGLTWGGIAFPWNSAHVLAPLITGFVLVGAFLLYEFTIPTEPTIPFDILSNGTSLSGFLATTIHGVVSISVIYYIPTYFQACFGASPVRSGVDMLSTSLIVAPFALIGGIITQALNRYRPANISGWVLLMVGFGLLSTLTADSSPGRWVGYQIVNGAGSGLIFACALFPVLAPLLVERNASALAFYAFCRAFSQTWGITISATILQNQLIKNLPRSFLSQFPAGAQIAYSAIPLIKDLDEPLRTEVRVAFATSMAVIWKTMIGISGLGVLTLAFLKEVPMAKHKHEAFALVQESKSGSSQETGMSTAV